MIVYLDASAMVKLYVEEPGSREVAALARGAAILSTALITMAEVSAALARAYRRNLIPAKDAERSLRIFQEQWEYLHRLQINEQIVRLAAELAWKHRLKGYDAIHLACALLWRDIMGLPVVLATYDQELWRAAQRTGMEAWPTVHP